MISWYFMLGVLFAFVMELTITKGWNPKVKSYQKVQFNNLERVVMIVLWPIFLIKAIDNYLNKRNDI